VASFNDVIKGLQILVKYADPDDDIGGADHDLIYALPPDVEVSDADAKALEKLGWFFDDEFGWAHHV